MASAAALTHRGIPKPAVLPASNQPAGTFSSGTKVQVGNHRVTIERYLSEGGFAHVYVVRVPRDNSKYELAVLKRVAVPDKNHLANMRTEVETMKKLKGHRHVVTYMDSHASQLKGGGYEVFLLMEFCGGGGLIDFMNTRLQHRLTEPEILKIFGDVAEGLAAMHYLKPPLLHRDLKVENVLISKTNSGSPLYKLCDFGSAAVPRPAATTPEEGRLIEDDVQQHTTMQYRSPEMIDVWRKQPINEKADIWALGVFLYKLCYYTTPFEDVGQMAILNASYKYPAYPTFSDRLKKFITWMLKEDPRQRPNIYQVIKEACSMRGTEIPIKDIYADRTVSEARRNEALPSPDLPASPPPVGLQKTAPQKQTQALPEIAPMRRGRPAGPAQQAATAAQPKAASSPAKGDPFAALDSKNYNTRVEAVDELSKRFPSLDEFSITQEKDNKFPFSKANISNEVASAANTKLSERVTQALADDAFAKSKALPTPAKSMTDPQLASSKASPPKQIPVAKAREKLEYTPLVHQPTPVRPGTTYTTRGVGSSPPPVKPKMPAISSRPIWRVPDSARSSSQPRASLDAEKAAALLRPGLPATERPALMDIHRSKSQAATQSGANLATSSRPSLETRRPTTVDLSETELTRARSAQNRSRPSSVYLDSNIDFLRDQESSQRQSIDGKRDSRNVSADNRTLTDEQNINDDIDFLRTSEDGERPRSNRKLFGHKKRTSLGNALGRFGDAFKRRDSSQGKDGNDLVLVTPDPEPQDSRLLELSPIEGSEATPSKHSEDLDLETEDLPPDVKRELERRRQLEEEARVADGAAQYRARIGEQGTGSAVPTRASTIQQRVQSLLDEGRQSPVKRTAEGYGRYTGTEEPPQEPPRSNPAADRPSNTAPPLARKPAGIEISNNPYPRTRPAATQGSTPPNVVSPNSGTFAAPPSQPRVVTRPSVPPKSTALRTGGSTMLSPISNEERPPQPPRPSGGLAALLAKDLEGVPDYPPRGSSMVDSSSAVMAKNHSDDPELDFEKRYPSLSGIELVETEISGQGRTRVRDV